MVKCSVLEKEFKNGLLQVYLQGLIAYCVFEFYGQHQVFCDGSLCGENNAYSSLVIRWIYLGVWFKQFPSPKLCYSHGLGLLNLSSMLSHKILKHN